MNSSIYHAGETPEYCYILAKGNVKIEAPGFSARKMMDMSIIGENTVFGERDLNEEKRAQNAICCSAHCRVLALRKEYTYGDVGLTTDSSQGIGISCIL